MVRALAARHQSLEHRIQTASDMEAESAATLKECEEESARTPAVRDVTDLEGAVALVRKKGDLEGEYAGFLVQATEAGRDAGNASRPWTGAPPRRSPPRRPSRSWPRCGPGWTGICG